MNCPSKALPNYSIASIRRFPESNNVELQLSASDGSSACTVLVSALPCDNEPRSPLFKKLGKPFANALKTLLASRYLQMRKMNPAFVNGMDGARAAPTLTEAVLCLVHCTPPPLLAQLAPLVVQVVRRNWELWAGSASFYPRGSLYVAWLVGRLVQQGSPNAIQMGLSFRKLVMGG